MEYRDFLDFFSLLCVYNLLPEKDLTLTETDLERVGITVYKHNFRISI
jgi:hypothetical protein